MLVGHFPRQLEWQKVCSNAQPHRKWLQLEWPPQWSCFQLCGQGPITGSTQTTIPV